jgi:hypothetical protein
MCAVCVIFIKQWLLQMTQVVSCSSSSFNVVAMVVLELINLHILAGTAS